MNGPTLELNAESLNSIVEAMTSLAHAIIRNAPPEQRDGILLDLEYMAERWNAAGHTATETILLKVAGDLGALLNKDDRHSRPPE